MAQDIEHRRWAEHRRLAQRRLKPREDRIFLDRLRMRFGERADGFSEDLLGHLHELWNDGVTFGMGSMCDHCGSTEGVAFESADTAYDRTDIDPDPNAPIPLCRDCAEEHHAHWDDMWHEYRASQGVG